MTSTPEQPPATSTELLDPPPAPSPTSFGSFVSRAPVACDEEQLESMVAELRAALDRKGKSAETRRDLLDRWLDVERFLTDAERTTIQEAVFAHLFPDSSQPRPNRGGVASSGGN